MSSEQEVSRVVVFDVETTGTDPGRDQVIEMCVQFGLEPDTSVRTWRIKPRVPISPGAYAVHGICEADLRDCPSFDGLAGEIRSVLESAEVLVGYNVDFDIEMLQAEYDRLRLPRLEVDGKKVVDAFRLWQQCEPRSLQDAHRRFVGNSFQEAHSASADVAATGRVLRGMISAFGLEHRGWDSIAQVCRPNRKRWVGPSRHIQWDEDGKVVLGFGKHSGMSLWELARMDNGGYVRWMLGKDFPTHVTAICRQVLDLPLEDFLQWIRSEYGSAPKQGVAKPLFSARPSAAVGVA